MCVCMCICGRGCAYIGSHVCVSGGGDVRERLCGCVYVYLCVRVFNGRFL